MIRVHDILAVLRNKFSFSVSWKHLIFRVSRLVRPHVNPSLPHEKEFRFRGNDRFAKIRQCLPNFGPLALNVLAVALLIGSVAFPNTIAHAATTYTWDDGFNGNFSILETNTFTRKTATFKHDGSLNYSEQVKVSTNGSTPESYEYEGQQQWFEANDTWPWNTGNVYRYGSDTAPVSIYVTGDNFGCGNDNNCSYTRVYANADKLRTELEVGDTRTYSITFVSGNTTHAISATFLRIGAKAIWSTSIETDDEGHPVEEIPDNFLAYEDFEATMRVAKPSGSHFTLRGSTEYLNPETPNESRRDGDYHGPGALPANIQNLPSGYDRSRTYAYGSGEVNPRNPNTVENNRNKFRYGFWLFDEKNELLTFRPDDTGLNSLNPGDKAVSVLGLNIRHGGNNIATNYFAVTLQKTGISLSWAEGESGSIADIGADSYDSISGTANVVFPSSMGTFAPHVTARHSEMRMSAPDTEGSASQVNGFSWEVNTDYGKWLWKEDNTGFRFDPNANAINQLGLYDVTVTLRVELMNSVTSELSHQETISISIAGDGEVPELSISPGGAVAEADDVEASFTVTSDVYPGASGIEVRYTPTATSDFLLAPVPNLATRTNNGHTSGSITNTLMRFTDQSTAEDGTGPFEYVLNIPLRDNGIMDAGAQSISVVLNNDDNGTDYEVLATSNSASVTVHDGDSSTVLAIDGAASVSESAGTASFTVTATAPANPGSGYDVTYVLSQNGDFLDSQYSDIIGQEHTAGLDFTGANRTFTATLTFALADDMTDELNGSVKVALRLNTGGTGNYFLGGKSAHAIQILDDDAPTIWIDADVPYVVPTGGGQNLCKVKFKSSTPISIPSGSTPNFLTVHLSIASGGSTINWFAGFNDRASEASVERLCSSDTITFELLEDTQSPKRYTLGTPSSVTFTKVQASKPGISVAIVDSSTKAGVDSVNAGDSFDIAITATPRPTSATQVLISITDASNFISGSKPTSISLDANTATTYETINPLTGASTTDGTISVMVNPDTNSPATYIVDSTVGNASLAVKVPPAITINQSSGTIVEANGATLTFDFTLQGPISGNEEITHSVSTDSTADPSEYSLNPIAFSGRAASLTVTLKDDNVYEGDETIVIDLTVANAVFSGGGNTHTLTVTITDDETKPEISFKTDTHTVAKGEPIELTLVATVPAETAYSIDFTPTNTTGDFLDTTIGASGVSRSTSNLTFEPSESGSGLEAKFSIATRSAIGMNDSNGEITVILDTPDGSAPYTVDGTKNTVAVAVTDEISVVSISVSSPSKSETDPSLTFNVELSEAPDSPVSVSFSVAEASTAEAEDYTVVTNSPLEFSTTETTKTITINITDDMVYEGDETIILTLTVDSANNAEFAGASTTGTATGTITDNEEKPQLSIVDTNLTVTEGESASISVKASVRSEAIYPVAFTSANVSGDFLNADSGDSSPKTFTFESQNGEWIDELTIATRAANGIDEDYGEILVTLVTPENTDGYTVDGTANTTAITVLDADIPKLSISNAEYLLAGRVAMFQVTADIQPWQSLSVRYTATDDMGSFLDASNLENPQTLTFSSSNSVISAMLEIVTQNDPNSASGTIRVELVENGSNPKPYELADETSNRSATVTVTRPTVPSLIIRDSEAREGPASSTTVMEFTVVLSPTSNVQVDVTWTTSSESADTALAGTDYETGTGLLTFNPGDKTKTFQVTIIGDGVEDGDKTFTVTLSNPTGGAVLLDPVATGTILDFVAVPELSIVDMIQPVSEGSAATIRVKSSIQPESRLSVGYTVTDMGGNLFDSATSDPNPKRMTFKLVGSEFIGELTIGTKSNNAIDQEPVEIRVVLAAPQSADGYTIDDEAKTALISVVDESVYLISISPSSRSVTAGEDIEITLKSSSAPENDLDVRFRVTQNGDYLAWPVKLNVRFNIGSETVSFTMNTLDNPESTGSGMVTVAVVDGTGYKGGSSATIQIMKPVPDGTAKYSVVSSVITEILTNIPPTPPQGESRQVIPTLAIRTVTGTVAEGESAVFEISASHAVGSRFPVKIRLSESGDFINGSMDRSVDLKAGNSETEFSVSTDNDGLAEADGRITATIQADSGYFIGTESTAHVIVSDALDRRHRKSRVKTALHAVLPDLLAHSTARTFAIANIRTAQGFNGSPSSSIELNGASPAMTALKSGGKMLNNGSADWQSLIDDSSFTVALYPEVGETSPAAVWGVGDKWSLAGDGNSGSQSWNGETYSGHFGFDARVGHGMLAGLAMSLSQSEISYGQTGDSAMLFDSMSTGVYPYFGIFSSDGNFGMQVLAGYGENELELKQEEYSPEVMNGHFQTVGFSGSNRVYSNASFGGLHNVELNVAGEAWHSKQHVDSLAGVTENLQVEVRHVRIAIEEAHEHHIGAGGTISPSFTMGLRGDGRNEKSNFGLNVGSAVKFDAFNGLEVSSSGKSFLSGLNRVHRWEFESSLDYDAGSDGKGVLIRMSRSWNDTDENAEPYLWRSELTDDSNSSFGSPDGGSMEIEVGYGFEILDGSALATPYSAFHQAKTHGSEFRVGSRIETSKGFNFELEIVRDMPKSGTLRQEVNLTGNINW